jgi:hypothetical protein
MSERSDRFFSWVWRVNGVLLLVLALAGVVGAAALIINVGLFWSRERPEQQLTNVAGANLGEENLRLGDFRSIAGTQLLYAQLASPSEYIGSGSSGGLGSARNLLFFDVSTKKAHWLLPDNSQTIESFSFLMDPPGMRYGYCDDEAKEGDQVTIAILLELQPSGPSPADAGSRTLAIAPPDGRLLTAIAEATEGLLGYHQPSTESVLVFYVSEGAARVLDADPGTRKVRSDALLEGEDGRTKASRGRAERRAPEA